MMSFSLSSCIPEPLVVEEKPAQTGAGDAATVEVKVEPKVEGTLMEGTETWDSGKIVWSSWE